MNHNTGMETNNSNTNSMFNCSTWFSWKELRNKIKNEELLSDTEICHLALYMLQSLNYQLVVDTFMCAINLNKSKNGIQNLTRLNFFVNNYVVYLCTYKVDVNSFSGQVDEDNEMLAPHFLEYTGLPK